MNVYRLLSVSFIAVCVWTPGQVQSEGKGERRVQPGPDLTVDVLADRHSISPYIYGIAFPDSALARETEVALYRWGGASTIRFQTKEGVSLYEMASEAEDLPNSRRDTPANRPRNDDLVNKTRRYAEKVRATDPLAALLGPGSSLGHYQDNGIPGDGKAEPEEIGQADYYLGEMREAEKAQGKRVLAYFDEHYSPLRQEGQTEATVLEATRSLWDSTYVEKDAYGQANGAINLIPSLHKWVEKDYPGTKISLSEYVWGDMTSLVGALAEADVLGIFGRERLDLACFSGSLKSTDPGANAFRIYRNYDGRGSRFGDIAVHAVSTDQAKLSIYGAERSSDHTLTLVVINKSETDLKSALKVRGSRSTETRNMISFETVELGPYAQVYRYSGVNLKEIMRRSDQTVKSGRFTTEYPARSATVVVLPLSRNFGGLAQ